MACNYCILIVFLAIVSKLQARTLVWSDDFNGASGSSPDSTKWKFDIGGSGWGNNEKQYYTDSTMNAALDGNGNLRITATREGAGQYSCWYGTCEYTSARILTAGKFAQTYGRFEARIWLPYGKGIWPAFWMLGNNIGAVGWPQCGEIDIMELRGSIANTVSGALHGPGYAGGNAVTASYSTPDGRWFSDMFHVFTVDWSPDSISWSVDGNQYATKTRDNLPPGTNWVFDHDFFILLNFAVGGNFDGEPNNSTPFPQSMVVDYVRVYSP